MCVYKVSISLAYCTCAYTCIEINMHDSPSTTQCLIVEYNLFL